LRKVPICVEKKTEEEEGDRMRVEGFNKNTLKREIIPKERKRGGVRRKEKMNDD
jgi:hypothetical protein